MSVNTKSLVDWKEMLRDISEVARIALKNMVSQSSPPLPNCYEREFMDVARRLHKHAVLQAARKDQELIEKRLAEAVNSTGGAISDSRQMLMDFERDARACLDEMEQNLMNMNQFLGQHNSDQADALRNSMQAMNVMSAQLLSRLDATLTGLEEQARTMQELKRQVHEDPLTLVLNRRKWDNDLADMMLSAMNDLDNRKAFSVALADLDHFKKVNDTYGHPVGDAVLKQFGGLLKQHFESLGTVYRYGGEEFGVVLPDMTDREAEKYVESFRQRLVRSCFIANSGKIRLRITASFGLSAWKPSATVDELVNSADKALYEAKKSGRNRVVVADQ